MRTTRWLAIVLGSALPAACAETQPLPEDPDEGYVSQVDARRQSLADARTVSDARTYADAGPGGTDGCGTLTAGGRCQGTTLTWCSSGEIRSIDCEDTGKSCTCDGDFCDCTDGASGSGGGGTGGTGSSGGCGSVTYEGQCNGNVLQYCENNAVVSVDCSQYFLWCDCPPFQLCDCWE